MAKPLRKPPGPADNANARAQEFFNEEVYDTLKLVGTVTEDIGSISAGAVATFTVSVPGAKADQQQTVQVAVPSAFDAGLMCFGLVTGDGEVTVRVHNTTGSPVNPASGTYGVRVMP